jgi:hypothetical protein
MDAGRRPSIKSERVSLYYLNEAVFEVPVEGMIDRTVHRLEALLAGGGKLSLSVHRAPIPAGRTLADLARENARNASIQVPGHRVIFEREVEVDGRAAVDLAAEWEGEGGRNYTRQAHLDAGGTWLVFAVNAPESERAACDALLERALGTFRGRG